MLKKCLAILLFFGGMLTVSVSCVLSAKAESFEVRPDSTTATRIEGSTSCAEDCFVSGGSQIEDSLFHSFERFNIPKDVTVTFDGNDVARIFARVSEGPSILNGTLAILGSGETDFFILNPYGVFFGTEATLQNVGSFVASTAESFVFADEQMFGVADITPPLLTVSIPVGLQFGLQSGSIVNRSRSSLADAVNSFGGPAGLQTNAGETLALVGHGVSLENGNLTANGGQVTLASVGLGSRVSLSSDLKLGYEGTSSFENVELTGPSTVDVTGIDGSISVRGHNIFASRDSAFVNQTILGSELGVIDFAANELIELDGAVVAFSPLSGSTSSGANLNISAKNLHVTGGAVLTGSTFETGGNGGALTINVLGSVEITGASELIPTLVTTSTDSSGTGGSIVINTQTLIVADGGQIDAATYGSGRGGDITINASNAEIVGSANTLFFGESVSSIRASSGIGGSPLRPTGRGGDLTINTRSLLVRDGAEVAVSSFGDGDAGNLNVNARSVWLADDAQLTAAATFGNGGNLSLESLETLVLRRGSSISTRAGLGEGQGDGGNLSIDADFVVAGPFEDTDIVARASQGRGGNILIGTRGLYGLEERRAIANNGTNDIDASSDFGVSGNAAIEQLTAKSDLELTDFESRPLETAVLVSQRCGASGNSFVVTGRGGTPAEPADAVAANSSLVDLGEDYSRAIAQSALEGMVSDRSFETSEHTDDLTNSIKQSDWIEASSWSVSENGQVKLMALPGGREFSPMAAGACSG